MAYPRSITMFVGDTRPTIVAHLLQRKTNEVLVCTNVQSIKFAKYNLATGAMEAGFPKAATWNDQDNGVAQYAWATDGSEAAAIGRFAIYFILYWAVSTAQPQSSWSAELTIKYPWEAMD